MLQTQWKAEKDRRQKTYTEVVKRRQSGENGVSLWLSWGYTLIKSKRSTRDQNWNEKVRELNKSGCKHLVNIIGNHELFITRKGAGQKAWRQNEWLNMVFHKPWADVHSG